jgi:hypothetical protein
MPVDPRINPTRHPNRCLASLIAVVVAAFSIPAFMGGRRTRPASSRGQISMMPSIEMV